MTVSSCCNCFSSHRLQQRSKPDQSQKMLIAVDILACTSHEPSLKRLLAVQIRAVSDRAAQEKISFGKEKETLESIIQTLNVQVDTLQGSLKVERKGFDAELSEVQAQFNSEMHRLKRCTLSLLALSPRPLSFSHFSRLHCHLGSSHPSSCTFGQISSSLTGSS